MTGMDLQKEGWISPDDGVLVRDLNQNGLIDNGSELFGNQTVLYDGRKAKNGFEALADLDSNQDGVFDYYDPAYQEILIWQDKNQNGSSEYDELFTLEEIGIDLIGLAYKNPIIPDN